MKINQFNSQNATNSAITLGGVATGVMAGNVAFKKIPVFEGKNKLKRGILIALGLGLAIVVDDKDEAGKFVKGVGAGMAAKQAVSLLGDIIEPKEGIIKDACMGNPTETVVVYDNSYAPAAIEEQTSYEDNAFAMALPEQKLDFAMA